MMYFWHSGEIPVPQFTCKERGQAGCFQVVSGMSEPVSCRLPRVDAAQKSHKVPWVSNPRAVGWSGADSYLWDRLDVKQPHLDDHRASRGGLTRNSPGIRRGQAEAGP